MKETGRRERGDRLDAGGASRLLSSLRSGEPAEAGGGGAPERVAGYAIEGRLGRGAAGTVYLARRAGSAAPVALKMLDVREGASSRVWRELDLLNQVRAPGVVRLLDYGTADGRLYLATEHVEGEAIDAHCEAQGLSLRARVELLAQVADAVQGLHERGVIHRDVKPANVLVGPDGRPVLIDLGIAKFLGDGAHGATVTEAGALVGTPGYMAPEQAGGGGEASTRTDVFGLGALGYRLVTGTTPYSTEGSLLDHARRVQEEAAREARRLRAGAPRALSAVLGRAVERSAAKRYASAGAFADDLRRWLRGEPVRAAAPSRWARATRWAARHPVATTAALCAVVGASMLGSAVGAVWWANHLPYDVRVSPTDWTVAELVSRSGAVVARWTDSRDRPVVFAETVRRPAALGGGRIALIADSDERADGSGLRAYRLGETETPLWTSEVRMPEALRSAAPATADEDRFLVRRVELHDVFPERAGPEVVAILRHAPWSPCAVQVYGLDGRLLYQVWHDGYLDDAHVVEGAGLLVAIGTNSETTLAERGVEAGGSVYPLVLFAVRPRIGETDRFVLPSRDRSDAEWCSVLLPLETSSWFDGGRKRVTARPYGVASEAAFALRLARMRPRYSESRGPVVTFYFDASGGVEEVLESTAYAVQEERVPAASMRWVDWDVFEGLGDGRGAGSP